MKNRVVRHAFAYAGYCPDLYARQEIASVFAGEHYLDFAELFDTIHAEDVQEMFRRWAQPNRSTMSVGRAEVTIERRKIMEHAISFPVLGLDFNINRVAVNLFGKDIYWYGIIICLGFVLAALYVNRRTKEFGVTSDNLMDCLIICVPVGIICARIYYVAFEWGYYSQHPE